jgi:hypothetical protein
MISDSKIQRNSIMSEVLTAFTLPIWENHTKFESESVIFEDAKFDRQYPVSPRVITSSTRSQPSMEEEDKVIEIDAAENAGIVEMVSTGMSANRLQKSLRSR